MRTQFGTGAAGLPGNDDAGQMSAWYVLSAMGFYPACPGTPTYTIGSPLFTRVVIHQSNGRVFTVAAPGNSAKNIFVQSATLNGRSVRGLSFNHSDLVNGSTLILKMGAEHGAEKRQDED
jgi:putative alpha-1,2-mannosidase